MGRVKTETSRFVLRILLRLLVDTFCLYVGYIDINIPRSPMIVHFTLHRDIWESLALAVKMERQEKRSVQKLLFSILRNKMQIAGNQSSLNWISRGIDRLVSFIPK